MLSSEKQKELIDSYLKGNLSLEESAKLENSLSSDVALKNEFDLQKSIVETIRANRKAELKGRLNKIEIKASAPTQTWWRYVAVLGLVTSVSTWFYVSKSRTETLSVSNVEEVRDSNVTENVNQSTTLTAPSSAKEATLENKTVTDPDNKLTAEDHSTLQKEAKRARRKNNQEVLPSLPNLHSPEASAEPIDKDLVAPDGDLTKTPHINEAVTDVEVVRSKKHKFHYRYFDNKLFLYGNFDAKTYDILELNTSKGQSFYLKFENSYYSLEPNKTEISKLEQVKDRQTINELKEVQKK